MNSTLLFHICFVSLLVVPTLRIAFFPLFFAPYIVLCYRSFPFHKVLRKSILCGLLMDCCGDTFGTNLFIYPLATIMTGAIAKHFFEDRFFSLPLITALFSFFFFLSGLAVLPFFGIGTPLALISGIMPLLETVVENSLFAMLVYSVPNLLIRRKKPTVRRQKI